MKKLFFNHKKQLKQLSKESDDMYNFLINKNYTIRNFIYQYAVDFNDTNILYPVYIIDIYCDYYLEEFYINDFDMFYSNSRIYEEYKIFNNFIKNNGLSDDFIKFVKERKNKI